MKRNEVIFGIEYGFRMESYMSVFFTRLNNFIIFIQIALGSAVFANMGSSSLFGAIISCLGIYQVVYNPYKTASDAKAQTREYSLLMMQASKKTDDELLERFMDIKKGDSEILGVFQTPAFKRSAIKLNLENTHKLNFLEKTFAFIGGDVPPDEKS